MNPAAPGTGGWFVRRGKNSFGPYSWDQVVEHARAGRIGKSDMLFDPSAAAWAKAPAVASLFGPGGAAAGSAVGLSAAAKTAATILVVLAVLMGAGMGLLLSSSSEGTVWADGVAAYFKESVDDAVDQANRPPEQNARAALPPEGVCYKGTFDRVDGGLSSSEECYLWVYTGESGTQSMFLSGDGLSNRWPGTRSTVPSGGLWGNYWFMNPNSMVEVVEIKVRLNEESASGTIESLNGVGSFERGRFTAKRITYEEYKAADD